jgi:hypothetical protein
MRGEKVTEEFQGRKDVRGGQGIGSRTFLLLPAEEVVVVLRLRRLPLALRAVVVLAVIVLLLLLEPTSSHYHPLYHPHNINTRNIIEHAGTRALGSAPHDRTNGSPAHQRHDRWSFSLFLFCFLLFPHASPHYFCPSPLFFFFVLLARSVLVDGTSTRSGSEH